MSHGSIIYFFSLIYTFIAMCYCRVSVKKDWDSLSRLTRW